jgi:hypothetical protein
MGSIIFGKGGWFEGVSGVYSCKKRFMCMPCFERFSDSLTESGYTVQSLLGSRGAGGGPGLGGRR